MNDLIYDFKRMFCSYRENGLSWGKTGSRERKDCIIRAQDKCDGGLDQGASSGDEEEWPDLGMYRM